MMKETKNNKYIQLKKLCYGEINPEREWIISIVFFILGAIILGWFSFYLCKNIQSGKLFENGKQSAFVPEKVNLINLDKTVLNYEGVSEKFKTLKRINLVDPSL